MGFFARTKTSGNAAPAPPGLNRLQARAQGIFVFLHRLAGRYRKRRASKVLEILNDADIRRVLDVGTAAGQFWKLIHEEIGHIRIVGLDIRKPRSFPHGLFVTGSGTAMPFRDKSFDCVICNSVIEHVGGVTAQQALASEIRRVCRRLYIVQVPAKHFPIEPHFLLPFVQYLPQKHRRSIHRFLYGFDPGEIHLLDRTGVQMLFPGGRIETEKVLFFTKSYVVLGPEHRSFSKAKNLQNGREKANGRKGSRG